MNKNLLFSIIIPVYNSGKYLEYCIDSILKQDFNDYEIILVDDGSTDNSPMICDKYMESNTNIKAIHKINGGVSSARYDGIKCSNGKYIICIDSDDSVSSNFFSTLSKICVEKSPDIVCYGFYVGNGHAYQKERLNNRIGYYSKSDIEKEIYSSLIQSSSASYFSPSLCSKAIRKELLIENFLVDPLATIGEDGACVIPCIFKANSMYILDEPLYYYRYNDESATKGKKVFNWEYPQIIAKHIENKLDMNLYDFKEQLNRKITHDVFNAAQTQFNRKEKYSVIVKDIKNHLGLTYYKNAINKCKFENSFKASLMLFAMKYRIIFLIYIYNKLI